MCGFISQVVFTATNKQPLHMHLLLLLFTQTNALPSRRMRNHRCAFDDKNYIWFNLPMCSTFRVLTFSSSKKKEKKHTHRKIVATSTLLWPKL